MSLVFGLLIGNLITIYLVYLVVVSCVVQHLQQVILCVGFGKNDSIELVGNVTVPYYVYITPFHIHHGVLAVDLITSPARKESAINCSIYKVANKAVSQLYSQLPIAKWLVYVNISGARRV